MTIFIRPHHRSSTCLTMFTRASNPSTAMSIMIAPSTAFVLKLYIFFCLWLMFHTSWQCHPYIITSFRSIMFLQKPYSLLSCFHCNRQRTQLKVIFFLPSVFDLPGLLYKEDVNCYWEKSSLAHNSHISSFSLKDFSRVCLITLFSRCQWKVARLLRSNDIWRSNHNRVFLPRIHTHFSSSFQLIEQETLYNLLIERSSHFW